MSAWVLIIFMTRFSGAAPSSAVAVPGFRTRESCVAAVQFVKTRDATADAYCVEVR